MDLTSELWELIKHIIRDMRVDVSNLYLMELVNGKIMETNGKLKDLGMKTEIYLHQIGEMNYIKCKYNEDDITLLNIDFIYLFIKIYSSKDYIFYWFHDDQYVREMNIFFDERDLPYKLKVINGEVKMYNITSTEYSLKL